MFGLKYSSPRTKNIGDFKPALHPMSWPKRLLVISVAGVFWFGLLYPLMPSTVIGLIFEIVTGILVFAYIYASVRAIFWLQAQTINSYFLKTISVIISISAGLLIFLGAYLCREFLSSNFKF